MIDKNLLQLLGGNKKYIFYTVCLMVLGLFANVGITACICTAIGLAVNYGEHGGDIGVFLFPSICAVICAEIMEIEASFGNVQVEMEKPKEYNMELTTEFGEIRVEDQECDSTYKVINDNTEKQIVINNSSGDIVINSVN